MRAGSGIADVKDKGDWWRWFASSWDLYCNEGYV